MARKFLNSKMTSGYISSTLNGAELKKKIYNRYSDNRKLQSREHTHKRIKTVL